MFTGIIADMGKFVSLQKLGAGMRMTFETNMDQNDFALGESIAVNGVCLTVDDFGKGRFSADVSPESLKKTNLGELSSGDMVNLERALRPIDRLGGHFVSGHVDGVGSIISREAQGDFEVITFGAPQEVTNYIVTKGSVAVDGVSLTVAKTGRADFSVAVIPHTLKKTTLNAKKPGSKVNLEADILAKYVEKFVKSPKSGGLTMEMLSDGGFLR